MVVRAKSGFVLGIDKLRSEVDFGPYHPAPGAPTWMARLAEIARGDLGALAILGPAGISIISANGHKTRVSPDPTSLYIAALSDRLRGTGQMAAVGIPPCGRHLPLFLASAALLKSTLENARAARKRGSVLVISRDLDIRSRYCDVYVHKELLDDAHPGSRMRPNGDLVLLRSHPSLSKGDGGVCFYLPDLALAQHVDLGPALIILDLRYARWSKRAQSLSAWVKTLCATSGILALYTVGDHESESALSQAGFPDISLDHAAVATCSQQVLRRGPVTDGGIEFSLAGAPLFLVRRHVIEEISGSDPVEQLYSTNAKLLYDQQKRENLDLNRARWLLAVLGHMPVPLHWYEMTARGLGRSTIKRLTDLLGSQSKHEKGVGPIVQTVRMHLQQLYNQLEVNNPRAEALKLVIEKVATESSGKTVLLLVRDRVMAQAVDSWLAVEACAGAEWLSRLEVRGYDTYSEISSRQYSTVIINGVVPRRYNWALGAALGTKVIFIAYSYESEMIEQRLRSIYGNEFRRARAGARDRAVAKLLKTEPQASIARDSESVIPPLNLQRNSGRARDSSKAIKTARGLMGISEALKASRVIAEQAAAAATSVEQDSAEEQLPGSDEADVQEALSGEGSSCISFTVVSRRYGSGKIWLDVESIVECVRPADGEDILRLAPRNLRVGDVLLRMESTDIRGSLFDQMVQLAEGQPEMEYLASFRRGWREAIQRIAARNRSSLAIDYSRIFDLLKAAGAPIASEQTVRLWMHDEVIGPEAVASIQAVGQVSGSAALVGQAKQFDRAFRHIRAIHQGIGRRLSTAIRESFKHLSFGQHKTKLENLDDHLGIALDELLETVDLAEIRAISPAAEKRGPQIVGRFTASQYK